MNSVSEKIEKHNIYWCAFTDSFYIDQAPINEHAFTRYIKLKWNISFEEVLSDLRDSGRIYVTPPKN